MKIKLHITQYMVSEDGGFVFETSIPCVNKFPFMLNGNRFELKDIETIAELAGPNTLFKYIEFVADVNSISLSQGPMYSGEDFRLMNIRNIKRLN